MKIKIFPADINASLPAPASKSVMQRILAAALLHKGITRISNAGKSNDDMVALNIIQTLGASVSNEEDALIISSPGFPNDIVQFPAGINCGESGLSARMFTPIAALASSPVLLVAEGSLQQRPMNFFDAMLPALGVDVKTANGKFPVEIHGPLRPKDILIDGLESSQFLTGLLFAFGSSAIEPVTISVRDLKSKPYIDLTIKMMSYFGFIVTRTNYSKFTIYPPLQKEEAIDVHVEGDWSNTAFLLVAGAIAGRMNVSGLDKDSVQADKAILDVLKKSGAGLEVDKENITVYKNALNAFEFDATDRPDLFPPLVTLAAYCTGTSRIKGVSRLAGKESDRGKALQDVFGKMGINISVNGDDMIIEGGHCQPATVSSHHDHRIAMAAAIAALGASGPIEIEDADAVNKSYPAFFHDMRNAGATITGIEP